MNETLQSSRLSGNISVMQFQFQVLSIPSPPVIMSARWDNSDMLASHQEIHLTLAGHNNSPTHGSHNNNLVSMWLNALQALSYHEQSFISMVAPISTPDLQAMVLVELASHQLLLAHNPHYSRLYQENMLLNNQR